MPGTGYMQARIPKTNHICLQCANASKYHIRRAAYQLLLWKYALTPVIPELPSLLDYGWDKDLQPIMCDRSPVHDQLLISCHFKSTHCEKRTCKCFNNDMQCTDACLCPDCNNGEQEYLEDSADSEDE